MSVTQQEAYPVFYRLETSHNAVGNYTKHCVHCTLIISLECQHIKDTMLHYDRCITSNNTHCETD